jgi:hypothetical protein
VGDELNQPRYRRTPERERPPPPGRLPGGRRLVIVVVGLVLLACLTVAIVVVGGDDDEAGDSSSTTSAAAPAIGGRAPDVVVAAQVLPATLGAGWVEVSRENDPVPAELDETDPCATAGQPIQEGLVVRAALDRLGPESIVEQAALVGGVVVEGTPVPRLDERGVVDCLQTGLVPQVAEESEVVPVEQPTPDAPDGAELSGARFEVRQADGTVHGRFDLLLLRRDRAVSFLLVVVLDVGNATPLDALVAVLDAPLVLAAGRLN